MLPTEFYLQNATTLLLWLFQMCSHDALVFLILLGVLVVVFSFSILGLNITRLGYGLVWGFANMLLRKMLCNYFSNANNLPSLSSSASLSNTIFRRLISDSTSDSNTTVHSSNPSHLPRYLALQPAQWAAIEAALTNAPSESDNTVFNSILDTTGQFSAAQRPAPTSSPPLRRSARLRRPRHFTSL